MNINKKSVVIALMSVVIGYGIGYLSNNKNLSKQDQKQIQSQKIEANEMQDNKSILCTNYNNGIYTGDVLNVSVKTKIYDLGYAVYSKEFADKFGYPETNIYQLDKNIGVMEIRMITEGGFPRCYLNILVKKNIGLDVPEISYFGNARFIGPFNLPKKVEGYKESEEDIQERLKRQREPHGWVWENYYSCNFGIAVLDYEYCKKSGWLGCILKEYSKEYYKDYDYFSISIGISSLTRKILQQPNASIWIKKKEGVDYSKVVWAKRDDFMKFIIPQELIQKILPIMEETDKYSFFNVVENAIRIKEGKENVN
jgi:hypothetical protein